MEPQAIKQERDSTKEEPTNEEAPNDFRASSLAQNLTNQDHRCSRNKGGRLDTPSRPSCEPHGVPPGGPSLAPSVVSSGSSGSLSVGAGDGKTSGVLSFTTAQTAKQTYSTNGGGGAFSPHSTVNGTPTPSPPALTSPPNGAHLLQPHSSTHESTMNAGVVPGGGVTMGGVCSGSLSSGVRQLTKVRRFLTTLQQFASDINTEVGERVRTLILNLLGGTITVEEFHCALQEVTHFPLRPFVLPFLRSHLPLLIRELHTLARRAGMSTPQYISLQESNLLDAAAGEPTDFFSSEVTNNKRKLEAFMDNGETSNPCPPTGANSAPSGITMNGGPISSGGSNGGSLSPPPSKRNNLFSPPYPTLGLSPELTLTSRDCRTSISAHDDEWKNIHVMLTCILSMVEKTRRALTMLQQREDREVPSSVGRCSSSSLGEGRTRNDYDSEVRRHATELVAHAIRSTEERVAEVKRKAEEAVMEVRKAAVVEVQRAVANAETKAQELVNAERSRIEGLMKEVARRESAGEQKVDGHQACWNCGRKAQDTCSGCNVAKYCSPFCQHKDWDHHHKVCSPALATSAVTGSSNKGNCKVHKLSEVTKSE